MPAPTQQQRQAAKRRDAHAWKVNESKFHTCSDCEANFRLIGGKLPAHYFLGKPCQGQPED